MKSARDWMKERLNGQEPQGGQMIYGSESLIEAIQADVLESAALVAYGYDAHTIGNLIRMMIPKARRESHGRPVLTEAEIKERGWPYGPETDL